MGPVRILTGREVWFRKNNSKPPEPVLLCKVSEMDDSHTPYSSNEKVNLAQKVSSCAVVVGKERCGKSSLVGCLALRKEYLNPDDDKTHVFNYLNIKLDSGDVLPLYDIGGHSCYHQTWRIFNRHQKGNTGIIAHELSSEDYCTTFKFMREAIEQTPNNNIIIALTKSDVLKSYTEQQKWYKKFINECQNWTSKQLQLVKKRLNKLMKEESCFTHTQAIEKKYQEIEKEMTKLKEQSNHTILKSKILFVTSSNDYTNIGELLEEIASNSKNNQVSISKTAVKLFQELGTLGIKSDQKGDIDVKTNLQDLETATMGESDRYLVYTQTSEQELKLPYKKFSNAREILNRISGVNVTDDHVTGALNQLHVRGLILYFPEDEVLKEYIFNDIAQLSLIMKELFNHDIERGFSCEEMDEKLRKEPFLLNEAECDELRKDLLCEGKMSYIFLKNICFKKGIDLRVLEQLLSVLSIAHPIAKPRNPDSEEIKKCYVLFPFYLTKKNQSNWAFSKDGLVIQSLLIGSFPETIFEPLLVSLYRDFFSKVETSQLKVFTDGMFIQVNHTKVVVYIGKSNGKDIIHIESWCQKLDEIAVLWNILLKLWQAFGKLKNTFWPELFENHYLECPHCRLEGRAITWKKPLMNAKEETHLEITKCGKYDDEDIPALMVSPPANGKATDDQIKELVDYFHKLDTRRTTNGQLLIEYSACVLYSERNPESIEFVRKFNADFSDSDHHFYTDWSSELGKSKIKLMEEILQKSQKIVILYDRIFLKDEWNAMCSEFAITKFMPQEKIIPICFHGVDLPIFLIQIASIELEKDWRNDAKSWEKLGKSIL